MIGKIAVSAANFAIDRPYSYRIPGQLTAKPGQRVQVPFGRGNKRVEGIVLTVEEGDETSLKSIEKCLDAEPILTDTQLRLAAFMRERYFCTFYDAIRVMLPAGLWFRTKETLSLTEDRSWKEKTIRKEGAKDLLIFLEELGGEAEEEAVRSRFPEEAVLADVIGYLAKKKWITARKEFLRRGGDKTEKIAALAVSGTEAVEYASRRPKSAAMQKSVLELLASVGSAAAKDVCYYTGASMATLTRLEKLGYVTLTERPVLRCREIHPTPLEGPLVQIGRAHV